MLLKGDMVVWAQSGAGRFVLSARPFLADVLKRHSCDARKEQVKGPNSERVL